jgi:DNA-binding NtrC family response regulator
LPDFLRTESTQIRVPSTWNVNEGFHLVLAWSSEQPDLVGSVAQVRGVSVLGRGAVPLEDGETCMLFEQQRPSGRVQAPELAGTRLSRRQIVLEPLEDRTLAVTSVGRCPLFLNGKPVEHGIVRSGDTVMLQDLLVFLVVYCPVYSLQDQRPAIAFPFGTPDEHGILGESREIWRLREALAFAAPASHHVLVQGESGSGKELAARAIHALSSRHRGAFVSRNAATLPEGLVDAEMFGTARGYPHAGSPERPGLIGEAHGGTLFLDEIGELRHDLQAHLLRVLDRGGEYQRLGDARVRRSDFRLVAATNRPIASLKHDLAARFMIHLRVPGLGERREDIPLLLRHLLAAAARDHLGVAARCFEKDGKWLDMAAVEPALVDALLRHDYTHHVRELNRLLWTALSSGGHGRVGLTAELHALLRTDRERAPEPPVHAQVHGGAEDPRPAGTAQEQDPGREEIEAALAKTGGKIAPAARLLGLPNRYALYRWMDRYGMRRT